MANNSLETVGQEYGKKTLVLDGGFATQLERIGKDLSQVALAARTDPYIHLTAVQSSWSTRRSI